jgi:hypothetical protein
LDKTYAQATGFFPAPISENFRTTSPRLREAAERIEAENRRTGIDNTVSGIGFIELPPEERTERENTEIPCVCDRCECGEKGIEKYVIIILAVIAAILIINLLVRT